jgi:hypothetical protein
MHCDRAECLTEASRGSIPEEMGKQKEWVVRVVGNLSLRGHLVLRRLPAKTSHANLQEKTRSHFALNAGEGGRVPNTEYQSGLSTSSCPTFEFRTAPREPSCRQMDQVMFHAISFERL